VKQKKRLQAVQNLHLPALPGLFAGLIRVIQPSMGLQQAPGRLPKNAPKVAYPVILTVMIARTMKITLKTTVMRNKVFSMPRRAE
jgi:hypothetical protein